MGGQHCVLTANQSRALPDVVLPRQATHGARLLEGEGPAVESGYLVALEAALKLNVNITFHSFLFLFFFSSGNLNV